MTETRTQDDEDEDEDEMEMTIEVATEATQGCDATRRLARQNCTSRCIGVKLVDLVFSHVPCAQAQRRRGVQWFMPALLVLVYLPVGPDVTWVLGTCRYSDAMSDWWRRINKRPSRATDAALHQRRKEPPTTTKAASTTTLDHHRFSGGAIPRGSFRVESTRTTTNLPPPSPPPPPPLLVASPSVVSLC